MMRPQPVTDPADLRELEDAELIKVIDGKPYNVEDLPLCSACEQPSLELDYDTDLCPPCYDARYDEETEERRLRSEYLKSVL